MKSNPENIINYCKGFLKEPYYMMDFPEAVDIADYFNISYETLRRRFRETEFGSYRGVKQSFQVDVSRGLFREGFKAQYVCSLVGYDEPSKFYRFFKHVTGETPTQYLKGLEYPSIRDGRFWDIWPIKNAK